MRVEHGAKAREILRLVSAGSFKMAEHAYEQSVRRHVTRAQIIHCARRCIHHRWQEEHQTYLFIGYIDSENTGGISAVLKEGAVIVTIFRRRLNQWEKRLARRFSKR